MSGDAMTDLLFGLPWWGMVVVTLAVFLLAVEMGFRLGRSAKGEPHDERMTGQISVLVGAILGLLGLLLAFSFGIVESRFSARKDLVIAEANAIGTSYLRAKILPEPQASRIQSYLREYVDLRTRPATSEALEGPIQRSVELHGDLWDEAISLGQAEPGSEIVALFVSSLNDVIDLHTSRVTVAPHQRFPRAIFNMLFIVSFFAMMVLGYGTGVCRRRAPLPTAAVILSISSVFALIDALDAPGTGLFRVDQWALEDLQRTLAEP
jgi:hypothetical protein